MISREGQVKMGGGGEGEHLVIKRAILLFVPNSFDGYKIFAKCINSSSKL